MKDFSYAALKRLLDIASAVVGIVVFSIPMIVVYVINRLEAPGPAVFVQTRVGRDGKSFKMYKFASMITRTEEQERKFLKKLAREKPTLWERYKRNNFKTLEDDPRLTAFGKFLRKSSLDEVPQFFNVLRGEMSLVGPRAYKPDELKSYATEHPEFKGDIKNLLTVKPGITGPWQVSGRSNLPLSDRLKMDSSYAKRKSLLEDVKIIFKTPMTVLRRDGAY